MAVRERIPSRPEVGKALGGAAAYVTKVIPTSQALKTKGGHEAGVKEVARLLAIQAWKNPVPRRSVPENAIHHGEDPSDHVAETHGA